MSLTKPNSLLRGWLPLVGVSCPRAFTDHTQ